MNLKRKAITAAVLLSFVIGMALALSLTALAAAATTTVSPAAVYPTTNYATPQAKLDSMNSGLKGKVKGESVFEAYGYELFYDKLSGEVAVRNNATGQLLFTNPYDVGASSATPETKYKLLSQIIIRFTDVDKETIYTSFNEAAMNDQIKMKRIKGGIRVEYTIGRVQNRYLVPKRIEKEDFQTYLMQYFTVPREIMRMEAYYAIKDPTDPTMTERQKKEMQLQYPITRTYIIYVFDPTATPRDQREIEGYIRKNNPDFTFEDMDNIHAKVEFDKTEKAPPLFKMALEYYLDEEGLYVRMPAGGIRFDESNYKLSYINVLPYMGAGKRGNDGFDFFPDGSGALVNFKDIGATPFTVTNKLYGVDFALMRVGLSGKTQHWRMPVYGVAQQTTWTDMVEESYIEVVTQTNPDTGETWEEEEERVRLVPSPRPITGGFLAIIEQGDSMAEISADHAGSLHEYNSVSPYFTPRPVDNYSLSGSGAGTSAMWSTAAKHKFTGNYIIRYLMLFDDSTYAEAKNATYMGMATAYRNYLEKRGVLTRQEADGKDIPLYIETFGVIKTLERVFGFPAELKSPLTTFDDAKTMIDELNERGINNINIKYMGWANDGMIPTAPTKISVESKLGGKQGLTELAQYAASKGATIYPNIDYTGVLNFKTRFTGYNPKRDSVKHMNDRIAAQVAYHYLFDDWYYFVVGYWTRYVVSPSIYDKLYDQSMKDYLKLEVGAVSVDSLGEHLSSDYNKKRLLNRDESLRLTHDLLGRLKEDNGKVLVSGGHAYTWGYVDAILNAPLRSSQYLKASASIPFFGIVTHGYIDVAGTPINMAGDYRNEVLKVIENGATPYFTLSYQNTHKLKQTDAHFDYYSIDFETWLDDVVKTYNELNEALKPVKNKLIVGHEFLNGDYNIVKVTYEGGISYILNYNNFNVEVGGKVIGPLEFIKG